MDQLSYKQKVTVMSAILVAMFFSSINQTIVGVALPRIIAKLGGMDYYSWVMSIYLLTSTIATILVGKLSDMYGRKYFILAGISVFMVGAFLCGMSKDIFALIASRAVQGIGAGIIMSTAFTAIGDIFSPRERGRWSGLMNAVFGVSSVLGPGLGGYIVENLEWRWIFWLFLPLGLVAFLMILFLFPKTERKGEASIDYIGSLLISVSIVSLLLSFSWAGTKYAWGSPIILGLFGTAAITITLLIFTEKRVKSPVLPLPLFKNSIFTVSNLVGFFMNAGMMGALTYLPFYIQGVLGIAPTYAGYVTMPMSVLMFAMGAVSGQGMTKTGKYKIYAVTGFVIMLAGMSIMIFMNGIPLALLSSVTFGLGLGLAMPVMTVAAQNTCDVDELGAATASLQLFRNLGATIGIAVMGTIMSVSVAGKVAAASVFSQTGLAPELQEKLSLLQNPQILLDRSKLDAIGNGLPAAAHTDFTEIVDALSSALNGALRNVFITGTVIVGLALALVFLLKEIPLRTTVRKMREPESAETQQAK